MSYGSMKRVLAAALLLAFTAPSTLAITSQDVIDTARGSMLINGEVSLADLNEKITLSLRDSDVKQVLRMFADKAGLNIVFHESVSGKITLDLVDTTLNEAFGLVLQVTGLNYYKQGNVMIVMSKTSPDNASYSKQEMMVFPIKYVSASKIADFLNKNVFSMQKPGISGVDAATVNSATNELIVFGMKSDVAIINKVIEQFDREPFSKTFVVNHTTPAEMATMICDVLLPSRGLTTGGSSASTQGGEGAAGTMTGGAADAGGGSAEALKLGEGLVACTASSSLVSQVVSPFDVQNLSITYFPQRGTITLMGGSEAQAAMIESFIKANDIKQPQAYLEVSIVELNEQGSKEFQNQWSFTSNGWGFEFDGASTRASRIGGFGGNSQFVETNRYVWDSGDQSGNPFQVIDPTTNQPTGEWKVPQQVVQTFMKAMPSRHYVSWHMNYLIENRKARVLASPKILITNGQLSTIDLTEDYVEKVTSEYLTSSIAGGGSSTGTAQRDYTIGEDLGIKVELIPFISPEGYVTLNIKPEYSTVAGTVNYQGDLVATLLSRRDLDLKNVRIKDGETLVIGGMIQEGEQKSVSKIPFFGDLPLIGPLFRSTSTQKTKSELVIMITPKIINDGDGTIAGL